MKAWNYIKNNFDQEMDQEYSTIVHILVKADHRKVIAWHSVSCKMTCSHIPDEKKNFSFSVCILYPLCSLQSTFCIRSALSAFCSLQSTFCTNRYPWRQYSLFLVTVTCTTHTINPKIPVCELIQHFCSFPC